MEKIKWGVLGTAGIAKGCTIPGMLLSENCMLYAIAGRSMDKALAYQQEFGFQKAYGSYEALLADPQVEAVYIPLPNQLHYEWTIKALQAKKHVLCEKPLAPTARQVAEMHAAAKENGVFLMEAYAYLHSPFIKAIKEDLDSGIIGEPLYLESEFITSDYDLSNIRMRRETCGGSTYDLGCYCTTMAMWMFGEAPEKVQATAAFSEENIDTLTTAILTFPGGKKAALTCGMLLSTGKDYRIDRLIIHGTKGCIKSDVQFNQAGSLSYRVWVEGEETIKTVQTPHNYALEADQLSRCIRGLETPHITEEFSTANARVLEQILSQIGY